MANTLTRWLPAPTVRRHTVVPRLTMLEDRVNPAYLFVDFGDRFPAGTLTTTTGAFRDVFDSTTAGEDVIGTEMVGANNTFNAAEQLNIVRVAHSATDRANMMAVTQRAFLPLNITVVELTDTPQTTADGRTVSGAASMADVIATLQNGPASSKDAYVFVNTFVVAPSTGNARTYGPGGGGLSPGSNGLGATTDLTSAVNAHDDVAVVYTGGGFNFNAMNNIAHEAGHLFGHQHAISNNGSNFTADQRLIHQAEIMSYENTNNTSSSMFARFPMARGDGNASYQNIASRTGDLTSYDQFRTDANIGTNPTYWFISGTGANDIITVTKNGTSADVTVRAYADTSFTTPIAVPGGAGATAFSYTVPLTRSLLIYAGSGNDRVELDGDLGVSVRVDGMLGTDTLTVDGKGAAFAQYTPLAATSTSVDQSTYFGGAVTSYGGSVVIGGANITFENYETTSNVNVKNVTQLIFRSPGGVDALTLALNSGLPRVSGTVNGGVNFVPLFAQTVTQLLVDAGNGDVAAVADTLTLNLTAGDPVPTGGVTFAGGTGADILRLTGGSRTAATNTMTGPEAGGITFPTGGPINYNTTETVDLGGTPIDALTVAFPAAANAISLEDDGTGGNSISRLLSTSGTPTFPTVLFRNPSDRLTLNSANAADTLTVAALPDFTASLIAATSTNPFGTVTFNGAITFATDRNVSAYSGGDILLPNATSDLILSGTGTAGLVALRSISVAVGASVSTTAGNILISANEDLATTSGDFVGVRVQGTVVSADGTVSVSGRGGTAFGGSQFGVFVHNGGSIRTTGGGAVAVIGRGGTGSSGNNFGVSIDGAGSVVTSGGGSGGVVVTGSGGSGPSNFGVRVGANATLASGGTGDLTVSADSLYVETATGSEATVRAGAAGTRTATLQTNTAGTLIDLGGADVLAGSPLTLGLTKAELDRVAAGTLVIGRATSGDLRLTTDLTLAAPTNLRLVSGGTIASSASAGRLNTAGGSLTLSGGTVRALRTGVDFIASTVAFTPGTTLNLAVNGTLPDTGFDLLSVSGALDLTGATLAVSGGHVPVSGQTFALASATPVSGTFAAPPPGGVITLNGVSLHLTYPSGIPTLDINRPPVGLSAGGPYEINRGDGLVVSAPAGVTDPDGDPLFYSWDVNGDGVFGDQTFGAVSDGGRTVTFTPAQMLGLGLNDGVRTRTLSVQATDNLTFGTTTASTTLTINGLGLNITAFTGPSTGVEGGALTFTASVFTAAPLPVTYTWTVLKNGLPFTTASTPTGTFTFTPDDNGTYAVQLRAADTGGAFDTATRSATVSNQAPVITSVFVSSGGVAGVTTVVSAAVTDPAGANDPLTYSWTVSRNGVTVGSGTGPTLSFTPPTRGTYRVDVTVADDDGGTATASTDLTISGQGVTITAFDGPAAGVEGGAITFTAVATTTTSLPITYGWTVLKNGLPFTTASTPTGTFTFTPDDNGTYAVQLRAADTGGAFETAAGSVTVTNQAPVITSVFVSSGGTAGVRTVVSIAATDPAGANDPLTYTWVLSRNGVPVDSGTGPTLSFTTPVSSTYRVDVTVTDDDGGRATTSRTFGVPPRPVVVTSLAGTVRVRDVISGVTQVLIPFGDFVGDVHVASGDLNGDGVLDLVVGAAPGGGPHVRAYDGASGLELASFFAFDVGFTGGVTVAASYGRIVVGAGAGGGPHVKMIDFARIGERRPDGVIAESALVGNFFAFDVTFTGGVTVATADVNRDGRPDVVVGAKSGGGPHVKVIDGGRMNDVQNGLINNAALLFNFFAFDVNFTGGVTVAAAEGLFAVGAGAGAESTVRVIDGVSGTDVANQAAFPGFGGGVRVAFADVNTDGQPDLITAAGPGGGPHVKAFGLAPFVELESVFIGESIDTRGVYV